MDVFTKPRYGSKVKFEGQLSFFQRLRYKYLTTYFLKSFILKIVRFVFLLGVAYIIIFPFISKIAGSFMGLEDFVDVQVKLIPKNFTLDTYKGIIVGNKYWELFWHSAVLSVGLGLIQTMVAALVGYGFAKFKFKGSSIFFLGVMLTMIIPHQTLQMALFMKFRNFDILGIVSLLSKIFGFAQPNLIGSPIPMILMSATGLYFKNGLFIFVMRQFFKGVPDELEEAAYVDGAGSFRTFFKIILPISIPMLVTIFMFAFSWQWTDTYYIGVFMPSRANFQVMADLVKVPKVLQTTGFAGETAYNKAILNTTGILILLPLVIIYLFAQKTLIQGIERTGVTG
ncbi:MAG: carbohydrate ABC transporter permease [Eubacteriales bacterium]|nr:carbohydrate ABC transporter permease [Eubacteriales bacterium]